MKNDLVRRLILSYLLSVGLVYVLGIGLYGNIEGLRILHQDIPAGASDAAFQVKALANLSAGVLFFVSSAGLVFRRPWTTPVTVIGLVWQVIIYAAELALFRYWPTLGPTVVVTIIDIVITYRLMLPGRHSCRKGRAMRSRVEWQGCQLLLRILGRMRKGGAIS